MEEVLLCHWKNTGMMMGEACFSLEIYWGSEWVFITTILFYN